MDDLFDSPAQIDTTTTPEQIGSPEIGTPSTAPASASSTDRHSVSEHPGYGSGFRVGFSEDRNKRCRRTMEDAHSFFYNFDNVDGQGFFAIFDGHAGKQAADWCGEHFHETFIKTLHSAASDTPIPEILHKAFLSADEELDKQTHGRFSGCTAIVAFLRTETDKGKPVDGDVTPTAGDGGVPGRNKRKLYAGNVGDARAVLSRGRQAVRMSYDHKGSDSQEAKRILDAGGFVMNDRVNGVLAVTRSLGDFTMKEFIVGAPFTAEAELTDDDPFLILACDGVWDVCSDQEAVDLVYDIQDPQEASEKLLAYALEKFSTDNLSVMVIRFVHREQPMGSDLVDAVRHLVERQNENSNVRA